MSTKEGGAVAGRGRRGLDPCPGDAGQSRLAFARDVLHGLRRTPKAIPSRWFYDEAGSRLFQRIMDLPEYYLTACELEILTAQRERIARRIGPGRFTLVELGAGDGRKTTVLLRHFRERGMDFRYVPIDICEPALAQLVERCGPLLPGMEVEGLASEYFEGLAWLAARRRERSVVLFLGSNVGNFDAAETRGFLRSLWGALRDGDLALVGFDLRKDVALLMRAYDDAQGVTAAFNLNLLRRINRELGGAFRLECFEHRGAYDARSGAMESYLVSRARQRVAIEALGESFLFEAGEALHTERSQKYLPAGVRDLAAEAGFETVDELTDARGYFLDALWRVRKG
jgi:dimethylhistidine N-methyltransferase